MICRRLIISTIFAMALAHTAIGAVEWQIIKVNGRDFLGVDNIARFYGFPDPLIEGKNIHLRNDKNELQFTVDSREMLINGVRNWLSFPVFVHDGKVVVSRID
ncbi:MAG: N-acetylmuramoyl-L-alanine amidase, partial [Verrucomicrobiota bacterium]